MRLLIPFLLAIALFAQNGAPRRLSPSRAPKTIRMDEPDWRFAHPNPTFLASINIGTLMRSALMDAIWKRGAEQAGSAVSAADIEKARAFFADVDRICISIRPGAKGQADGLILFTGRFENDPLTALLQSAKGVTWRRIDASSILLGQEASLASALRRLAAPPSGLPANGLFQKAKDLMDNDIWITGAPGLQAGASDAMGGIRNFSLGVSYQRDFRMDLAMESATAQGVEQILAAYGQAQVEMTKSPEKRTLWEQVSRYVHVERPSATGVRFTVYVAESEMNPKFTQGIAALIGSGSGAGEAPANSPAAPERKSVVIYGLDDEPRDVPLQKK